MIPDVYLALEGTGKHLTKAIGLDTYITDADSQIKYSAMSSAPTVATATLPENGRSVTIKAVRVGTATITVTARDGDNPAVEATISVTVVRDNAQPTTNDLSKADRDELEMRLYVADRARTDTVTVLASAGNTSSEPVEDSIASFEVTYGASEAKTSDYVAVVVSKGDTENQYVIKVTPTRASIAPGNPKMEMIKIYPKDMFEAPSSEAWEFEAMFNTPPRILVDSFGMIRLTRTGTSAQADPNADNQNAATIKIEDYFYSDSLDRKMMGTAATIEANNADAEVDTVGDTVCVVSPKTSPFAVVQLLNEGEATVADSADAAAFGVKTGTQALAAIRIDSRFKELKTDGAVDSSEATNNVLASGTGAFKVTIRCTDKDGTAEVTGTVVVQDA